jgi:hypothetical protein
MEEIHRAGVDDEQPGRRLPVLDQCRCALGEAQQLGRFGRRPPLSLIDGVKRGLVGEKLGELLAGVQGVVTR